MTLAACATQSAPPAGQLQVVTLAQGKPLSGAECVVSNLSGSWQVTTPGMVMLGEPNGDLRVVCNHPGYRSSEVVYRYPAQLTVDLTPAGDAR